MGSIINIEDTFSKEIEELCKNRKEGKYIDAILELCEKHGIEPESVAKLVTKPIREKLKAEFEDRNMLRGTKKSSKLPLD
jgi:hypothetical protein